MLGSLIPPGLRAGGWWWHQELSRQAAPLSTLRALCQALGMQSGEDCPACVQ